jgi:hypothetical protein
MQNIYRLALQVQDASNISGVIHSLHNEVLPAIRQEPGYTGTDSIAQHPVVLLFLDKIVSLTRKGWITEYEGSISEAYRLCNELAEGLAAAEAAREVRPGGPTLGDMIGSQG